MYLMNNVRIGPDGSIIKDDVVVESDGRTIIREDGTIESNNVSGNISAPARTPFMVVPPVSPLERSGNSNSSVSNSGNTTVNTPPQSHQTGGTNIQAIKEKEYDIQMQEARIRGAMPTKWIVITAVLCVIALLGLYFLFIPAIVTGIVIFVGFSKKSELEAEKDRMYAELDNLKNCRRQ